MVIAVDAVCVLNQKAVIDISPHLAIPNFRYVPGGMIDGSGYELGKLCWPAHWVSPPFKRKKSDLPQRQTALMVWV